MTSPGQSAPMVPYYPLHNYYRYANSVVRCIALGERLVRTGRELADLHDVVTLFIGSIGTSLVDWFPELDQLPLVFTAMAKALGEAWRLERRGLQVMVDSGTREGREWDNTPFMDSGRSFASRHQVHGKRSEDHGRCYAVSRDTIRYYQRSPEYLRHGCVLLGDPSLTRNKRLIIHFLKQDITNSVMVLVV